MTQAVTFATPHGEVSGVVQGPDEADTLVVLAPGAGAPMTHVFMEHVAAGLAARRLRVARFNFVYTEVGRRTPDRQSVLEDTFRSVLDALTTAAPFRRLIVGGKSMGGRVASHVVAVGSTGDGLLFLGYPLHPPGRPEKLRDAHLYDIEIPMLFIEGTRDPFCPLETLARVRRRLQAPTEVAVIDDGDHSFKVRKSSGRSTEDAWDEVVAHSAVWIDRLRESDE